MTYFVHSWEPTFREDGIFPNATMVTAVKALNAEVKSLAPVLNSGNVLGLVTVASSNSAAPVELMVKAKGQTLHVFAAIARAGTATRTFTVAGMTGDATATVGGEARTVAVVAGKRSDDFAANGVHLYEIDLAGATCR